MNIEIWSMTRVIGIFKRHWRLASIISIVVMSLISFKVLRQRSVFQATCKLEFVSAASEVSLDNRSLWRSNSLLLQNQFLTSQQIIMTSSPLTARVVTSLHLTTAAPGSEAFKQAQQMVAGALSIKRIPESQIFLIQARHHDPKMAMEIANLTAQSYIRYTDEMKVQSYKNSIDWLDEKLVDVKVKLEQAQRELIGFIEREKITSFGDDETKSPEFITNAPDFKEVSNLLERLQASKVDEELKLSRLKEKYTAAHPDYQKSLREIALLQTKIKEQTERLQQLQSNHEQAIVMAKKKEIEYSILRREVEVNKEIYNALIRKQKETDIGSTIGQSDARVIEIADLPKAPAYPNKPMQLLLACLIGLIVGVGYCVAMEYTDTTLNNPNDIENYIPIPLLAVFARFQTGGLGEEDPLVTEGFRILRTNLNFSFPKGERGRILMVGSTLKGEGKSTIALNLAKVTGELKRKTLLIDADVRARSLSKRFKMDEALGLTSYLIGESKLESICYATGVENLWVIPVGQASPQPSSLFDSAAMRELLVQLRDEFDEIIIDAPPISVVIDSNIIASMVDAVIMVIEAGRASRFDIKRALQSLDNVNAKVCGLVLNGVKWDNRQHYPYAQGYYTYSPGLPSSNSRTSGGIKIVSRSS